MRFINCAVCGKPVDAAGNNQKYCASCVKEKAREYNRKWRAENPEKVREYSRKYRAENLEKAREYGRKYYQ